MEFQTNLAVAIASQLRDEAHVILADLDHLLTDVVLGAAGYRYASPPGGGRERREARHSEEYFLLTKTKKKG